jgi:hypothetical protein
VGTKRLDSAEFTAKPRIECLFAVVVSVGDRDTAEDLVEEAFPRAWGVMAHGQQAPGPDVGGTHGAENQYLAVAAPSPRGTGA